MPDPHFARAVDIFSKANQVLLSSLITELQQAGILSQEQVKGIYAEAIDMARRLEQSSHDEGDDDDEFAYAGAVTVLSGILDARS